MHQKTRYAICGLSVRGLYHFLLPLLGRATTPGAHDFSAQSEVVGILDIDPERVASFNRHYKLDIPFFHASVGMEHFLKATRPDVLLVTGPDHTHAEQIIAGLHHDLRVISEKPVVISCEEMQRVFEAESMSSGSLVVAHNARYNAQLGLVRELILQGEIGRITNIEYVYNLDTFHGASYFYRWNRERKKSGGLSIHKGVHHFDVLRWLVDSPPEMIFGFGSQNYFGPSGAHHPQLLSTDKLTLAQIRARCPYFKKHYAKKTTPDRRLSTGWDSLQLPYQVQYPHDTYIYDADIDIEDTYSAVIQYRNGASVSYSCNFSTPIEGYQMAINGTKARIEISRSINPDPTGNPSQETTTSDIRILPLFGEERHITVPPLEGGHGGSDPLIQHDLFVAPSEQSKRLHLQANSYDGALAVACGEGLWRSIAEKRPFTIKELLGKWYRA